ncbi:MAG: hypothetical protein ACSLFP_18495, partial [Acidimicrobiales bacterium]
SLTLPADRNGPAGMANGGWLVGRLAEALAVTEATVTLRAPTPLERPLTVRRAGDGLELRDGDTLVAEATAGGHPRDWVAPVSLPEAALAETRFAGLHDHPFPTCFVCGTERAVGDGLRIFAGPVPGRDATVASWWTPSESLAGADGRIPTSVVAAALDCPTGWAHFQPGGVALLGRMSVAHRGVVRAGHDHVVVAERSGSDGRKLHARSALFSGGGRCLAVAEATWIRVDV